jgi:hypothetical protein
VALVRNNQLLEECIATAANNVPTSLILFTLMMEAIHSSKTLVLKEPHSITSLKMAFFKIYKVCKKQLLNTFREVSLVEVYIFSHLDPLQFIALFL